MKLKSFTLLGIFAVGMGCANKKTPPPQLASPSLFFHEVSGNYIASSQEEKLRYGETLKAYSLGRRIDPNDDSLMYEASLLYRVENDSSWNLQPSYVEKIPYAGTKPISLQDNDSALRAEIEVKANEQRALYRYLKEASQEANKQISALESSAQISRKLFEQNKTLKVTLKSRNKENQSLKADLEKLHKQMQALLKFYQEKQVEQAKSKFRRKK